MDTNILGAAAWLLLLLLLALVLLPRGSSGSRPPNAPAARIKIQPAKPGPKKK